MKRLLIISPHFPPINAADMHRVRQSLPYFGEFGWEPTVVTVRPDRVEGAQDALLLETVPADIRVIEVGAFRTRWTRRLGLGSLGLRSMWHYWRAVNRLLHHERFDAVYFSTTVFPVLVLGAWWKRRFGVPYIIDMQDPWHSDYYRDKPRAERPPKYWFSYRLNKWLEPVAMRRVDAIISVSEAYCRTLQQRYANIRPERCYTIPFGAFERDLELAATVRADGLLPPRQPGERRLVYVGRGGHDMRRALTALFSGFRLGLERDPALFESLRFYFVGTSYAPAGQGKPTVAPVAESCGVGAYVTERTDRVPYFEGLKLLLDADLLVVPGSDDAQYTASKLYPYILTRRPLLAVFHPQSSVVNVLRATRAGTVLTLPRDRDDMALAEAAYSQLRTYVEAGFPAPETDWTAFEPHRAEAKAREQVAVFDEVIQYAMSNKAASSCTSPS